jgi:uncharacterized lipoprotein YmbA
MFRTWTLFGSVFLLAGCLGGTTPTPNFYVLDARVSQETSKIDAATDVAIGVGPIVLPDTVRRPQIVTREGAHSIELAEFHRWGGDLSANMTRLMAEVLMQRLATDRVALYPWPSYRQLHYQIRVDVLRFDGALGGDAVLEGTWTLLDGDGTRELSVSGFAFTEPSRGGEYPHLVEAFSRLTVRLAEQIAGSIKRRSG